MYSFMMAPSLGNAIPLYQSPSVLIQTAMQEDKTYILSRAVSSNVR